MPPDVSMAGLSPISVLKKAITAVPAVKYALGIAGIAAAAAILVFFLGRSSSNIVLIGLVFVGMVLLFVFSVLINSPQRGTQLAGEVLVWSVLVFFLIFLIFTTLAVAAGIPCNWAKFLTVTPHHSCALAVERSSPPEAVTADARSGLPRDRAAKATTCGTNCVNAFTVDLNDRPNAPESRTWTRRQDHWEERYPNGFSSRHTISDRISLNDCDGTRTHKDTDPNLEFFIPDLGCGGMTMMFRYNKGPWNQWRAMQEIAPLGSPG